MSLEFPKMTTAMLIILPRENSLKLSTDAYSTCWISESIFPSNFSNERNETRLFASSCRFNMSVDLRRWKFSNIEKIMKTIFSQSQVWVVDTETFRRLHRVGLNFIQLLLLLPRRRTTWIFNYPSNVLQKQLSIERFQENLHFSLHFQPNPPPTCIAASSIQQKRQAEFVEKAKIINLIKRYNKNFQPRFECYASSFSLFLWIHSQTVSIESTCFMVGNMRAHRFSRNQNILTKSWNVYVQLGCNE